MGEELDKLFLDDDYVIGIHRTGYSYVDDEMINNIFSTGLINNGQVMQAAYEGDRIPDIETTVSLCSNFPILDGQLKSANHYKGSQGCVIVKIPKSYLGKKEGEIKPIYYMDKNTVKLLPEFVYGYIPVNEKGELGDIVNNPNYKDNHEYDDENLLYDSSVYYDLKKNGRCK